jgi:putative MATE family efflux protein
MTSSLQINVSYRQILKIAAPIGLALMVPQLNFIINNIFLGHLSEEALAIASITGVYYLIFGGIGYGLNNGLQSLISRRAGENRPAEIGKVFQQGVWLSMIIALGGILFTYLLAPSILKAVIHSPVVYEKTISFLHIRIWGLPLLYVYQMRNALFVGTNRSKYLVAGTLAEALTNVFFDYALIFGHFGFPQLGFNGAAVASIISEAAGLIVIFFVIRGKGIDKEFSIFRPIQWDKTNNKSIVKQSGPLVFQHAMSIISWFIFYLLIERNSDQTGLAVSNTMRNIFGFFGVFIWSFASTTNSMVSNIIGQGKSEQVLPLIKKIIQLNTGIAILVCIGLNIFPGIYLSVYGLGPGFVDAGIPVMRLVAFAMVLMSFASVWLNAVIGTGNSRVAFHIELIAIVLYCTYIYFVLEAFKQSIFWGWMSEMLYWSVLFIGSYFYMKSGKWKNKII